MDASVSEGGVSTASALGVVFLHRVECILLIGAK